MTYEELVAEQKREQEERNRLKPEDLFDESNTHWEYDDETDTSYLVYDGEFEDLAKEHNVKEDTIFHLFCEYEDMSLDRIETEKEIAEARKGEY